MQVVDRNKLERIALARQGLSARQPFGRGSKGTARAIRQLGYVQIDTISVVARAHDHVLRARVSDYSSDYLDRLLNRREIFEYRFPVASFRPIEDFRFTRLHAAKFRAKPRLADKALLCRVLDRVRGEGPLRSRDFEKAEKKGGGWWDWKPAKSALEQLYYQGDLMIDGRDGFEKSYDLTERVLPSSVETREPTQSEFASFLIESTLRAHGFASYETFAAGARHIPIAAALKSELRRRIEEGALCQFADGSGVSYWTEPSTLEQDPAPTDKVVHILSPFDNLVIHRERLRNVFEFDYLIECYVPEPKRKYGYYCMPIVYGNRFVGRMDCKAHREEAAFEIKALFLEPNSSSRSQVEKFADAFAAAVMDYANFVGCKAVVFTHARPRSSKQILRRAIASLAADRMTP